MTAFSAFLRGPSVLFPWLVVLPGGQGRLVALVDGQRTMRDLWCLVTKKRRHGKRHKVITGCHKPGNDGFRGAPEPSRNIFIYRVHPDTSKRDIEDGIRGRNFEVRDLVCISSEQSLFKSFKLTVSASQLSSLLTHEFPWPEGVKVRRFFPSRRDQASTKRWLYCAVYYALNIYIHIHIYNSNYGNEHFSLYI